MKQLKKTNMRKTLFIFAALLINLVAFSQIGFGYQSSRSSGIRIKPIDPEAFKVRTSKTVDVVIKSDKKEISKLDIIKTKIFWIIDSELPKQNLGSDVGLSKLDIVDLKEENNMYYIDGEFAYYPNYKQDATKTLTIKFKAEVKPLLDDFSVSRITYFSNGVWRRLFPANEF